MAMVSSSLGAINSLLEKLPAEPEFTKLRPYLDDIRQHLLGFCARGVVTHTLDRCWMKQLRELAYDIEDSIDKVLIQSGCWFKQGSDGSDLLQEFKYRIVDSQDLGKQFGLLNVGFADLVPSDVNLELEDYTLGEIMPSDRILCGEKPNIIGLSDQEREIVRCLTDDEKELKVVSILGP